MKVNLFQKYYRKMAIQGLVKSLLISLAIALGAMGFTALILWVVGAKITWIIYIVFAAVLAISTVLFYFIKYKPDDKMIARKLDETGLEERMITMLELEGDESFIARRQREDAHKTLASVNQELLKFTLGVGAIVAIALAAVFAGGGTTVSYLHEQGKIDSLAKIIEKEIAPEKEVYFNVVYDVLGDGVIHGKVEQKVLKGTDCSDVSVEAADGWVFKGWLVNDTEDVTCNTVHRKDLAVKENIKAVAVFEEIDGTDPTLPEDLDSESQQNPQQNGKQEPGELPPDSNSSGSQNVSNDTPQNADPSTNPGGGQYEESNQIVDGQTYYGGEYYDNAKEEAYENMKGNDDVTDEDKEVGTGYFDTIKG